MFFSTQFLRSFSFGVLLLTEFSVPVLERCPGAAPQEIFLHILMHLQGSSDTGGWRVGNGPPPLSCATYLVHTLNTHVGASQARWQDCCIADVSSYTFWAFRPDTWAAEVWEGSKGDLCLY